MDYAAIKLVHVGCALSSYGLFVLRGIWRFGGSPLAQQRWVRIVPHANDTVLLAAALAMACRMARFPGFDAFLAAKVAGVAAYILLGITAFRWARSRRAQWAAWLAAQCVFVYIVAVAIGKRPGLGLVGS